MQLAPVLGWDRIEGEDVLLCLFEQRRDLLQRPLELADLLAKAPTRLLTRLGDEDRPDQRAEQPVGSSDRLIR